MASLVYRHLNSERKTWQQARGGRQSCGGRDENERSCRPQLLREDDNVIAHAVSPSIRTCSPNLLPQDQGENRGVSSL